MTELDPVVVYSNGQTGAVAGPSNITIYAKKDVKDTSCYTEKGALKIPMANEEQMFLRPAIMPGNLLPLAILVVGKCLIQQYFCLELLILPQRMRYLKHYR
mgnify:FL=1